MKKKRVALSVVLYSVAVVFSPSMTSGQEPATTSYIDGNRTIKLTLVSDVVLAHDKAKGRYLKTVDPDLPGRSIEAAAVGPPDMPVFSTDTGQLLAPVGGIILFLDSSWTREAVSVFLDQHGIAEGARSFEHLANAYAVRTAPGMPAIELANRLAALEGVVLSTPNFWREVEAR